MEDIGYDGINYIIFLLIYARDEPLIFELLEGEI
jgi:hypothetical protein